MALEDDGRPPPKRRRDALGASSAAPPSPSPTWQSHRCEMTSPKRRRRCRTSLRGALVASAAVAVSNSASPIGVAATTNFCGATWADASSNCDARQPCPQGTDQECTSGGVCWADTECDTAAGHGILYDKGHPSHMRFCGKSWNDASDNCAVERHCPGGESTECPGDEECYSFLSCNYVDLIGGPSGAIPSGAGGGGDSDRLPGDDPTRNNFCGWDWNGAQTKCDDEKWCPSGSDDECPSGMTCFAGTECKYISDLHPTGSPSEEPTGSPTPAPIVYETEANTSFCGNGWEDARKTCRIASHCPSGRNADCPGSQSCFSWMMPCNILDFRNYLEENGQEIMGAEHWLLPDDWVEEGGGGGTPQLPPADISMPTQAAPSGPGTPQTQPSPADAAWQPTWTRAPVAPTPKPSSGKPTIFDPNRFDPKNHIFCGKTWTDASERCSPETFCEDGALHRCEDSQDYCWVGIDACNAATFRMEETTPAPTPGPEAPAVPSTTSELATLPTYSESDGAASAQTEPAEEETSTSEGGSYCAKTYLQLVQDCANLDTCSPSKPCPDRYQCFSNVKCAAAASTPTTAPPTPRPTLPPVTPAPITNAPTGPPVTDMPTYTPTIFSLSEEEVAQRLTNMNSYCATSYGEVLSSCAVALHTCNPGDMKLCPPGTNCFENIICPDSALEGAPITAEPIPSPTPKPVFSIADVAPMEGQNYCSTSYEELQRTCATAPTCNDGDGPCPSGTFCFGNHMCDAPAESGTAVMTTSPTPLPTTLAPIQSPNGYGNEVTLQNYCSTGEDALEATCATAKTCNDGDGPCPPGTFCFAHYSCPSRPASTTNAPVTSAPTPRPTPEPTKPVPVSMNMPDASGEAAAAQAGQNYCAKSFVELETTCALAPTCNDGDAPCPKDTFCFPNVVCESGGQSAGPLPLPPVEDAEIDVDTTTADPTCNALCLQPITYSDCESALNDEMDIFSCTSPEVIVGDLCAATGQCGTDFKLKNCPDDLSVYIRVLPLMCKEQGLASGSGVIPGVIADVEGDRDGDEESGGFDASDLPIFGFGGLQNNATASEVPASNASSSANADDSGDPWSTEQDEGSPFDVGDWWVQQNSALERFGAWKTTWQCTLAAAVGFVLTIV